MQRAQHSYARSSDCNACRRMFSSTHPVRRFGKQLLKLEHVTLALCLGCIPPLWFVPVFAGGEAAEGGRLSKACDTAVLIFLTIMLFVLVGMLNYLQVPMPAYLCSRSVLLLCRTPHRLLLRKSRARRCYAIGRCHSRRVITATAGATRFATRSWESRRATETGA